MRRVVLFGCALILAGCNTAQQDPSQAVVFGRIDCKVIPGNPKLETEFEHAKAICLPRAQAAAISGTAAMPVGYGIGGAIASGIERGMTQRQIGELTAKSCMAEQGYFHKKRIEHDLSCGRVRPQANAAHKIN